MIKWGCTSYKRTLWARDDGTRMYEGHFSTGGSGPSDEWETSRILFWASRPVLALRKICQSGNHPSEYHGQTVN